jgi:magnesium-transporting ATPase (P-type)
MNKIELLILWLMSIPRLPILIILSSAGIFIGVFLIVTPTLAIEIQKKFYEKINWRIEPISMEKEIRNTQIMGWLLTILVIIILVFVLTNKSIL